MGLTPAAVTTLSCPQLIKFRPEFENWVDQLGVDLKAAQAEVAQSQAAIDKANNSLKQEEADLKKHQAEADRAQKEFDVAEEFLHSPAASDSNNFQNFLREAKAAAQRLATAKDNIAGDQHNIAADQQAKADAQKALDQANQSIANIAQLSKLGFDIIIAMDAEFKRKCKAFTQTTTTSTFTQSPNTPTVSATNSSSPSTGTVASTSTSSFSGQAQPAIAAGNSQAAVAATTVPFLDGGTASADPGLPTNSATGFADVSFNTIPNVPDATLFSQYDFQPPPGIGGSTVNAYNSGGSTINAYGLPLTNTGQVLPGPQLVANGGVATIGNFGSPFTSFPSSGSTLGGIGSITVTGGGGGDGSFSTGSLGDINISTSAEAET